MEQQIQQLIDLTEKGLTEMAGSMGVALPQLWEILIKQQYVEAVQAFSALAVCLIIITFIFKKWESLSKSSLFDIDNPTCLIGIIGLIVLLVATIICSAGSMSGIGKMINPEYYAIEDITRFISNITNK